MHIKSIGKGNEMKIVVLDGYTTNPGDLAWTELEKLGDVEVYPWTEQHEVQERLKGAAAAITNKVAITEELLSKLPDLKYIGILATGMDHVDLEAAKRHGVTVTNVPVYASNYVSQLAFALILELCYKINDHHRSVVEDMRWSNQPYNSYWLFPLVGLYDKTIGIVGMGRIGERTAQIAMGFGMKVIAHDVYQREIPGVEWVEMDELFKRSDFISLHCPLFESNRGMVNKEKLALMKKTAYIVNTSRGPLINEQDLADALNNGDIAGAGLDVLMTEPPSPDNPLLRAKNTVITPHIGWATADARGLLIKTVADNLEAFMNGEKKNVVNGL